MKKLILTAAVIASVVLASCSDDDDAPVGPGPSVGEEIIVSGTIEEDQTWSKDNIYILEGKVVVDGGATLTIDPGTIIKGGPGQNTQASALVVDRDATLNANGTADEPIIFTSASDDITSGQTESPNLTVNDRGLWGGVIVLGNAPSSFEGDANEELIEGIPANSGFGLYGGNDPADSSGSLTYVSIRHGGANIGEGNEINGLTLGGVGSGTTINHIEVIANLDDGVEFFGGTVDASNIVVWGVGDDSVDIDQAYSGTVSNVAVVMTNVSDHGLEIDGPEGSLNGMYTLRDVTIYSDDSEINADSGNREFAQFRSNAMGVNENILLVGGLEDSDFTLQDDENVANNYTAGDLTFSTIEIVPPQGVTDISTLFTDGSGLTSFQDDAVGQGGFVDAIVNTSEATVGANTNVFGWTWVSLTGAFGTGSDGEVNEVTVSGTITENITWTNNNIYILEGKVVVDGGAVLNIEAGTVIKGAEGQNTQASALVVDRDATINANGTAEEPIIFTSVLDDIMPGEVVSPNLTVDDRGLWGGVIVLGNAPSSLEGDAEEELIEGIPAGSGYGLYGGSDPADNSGTIEYISIRHGGANIGEGNEINGLTLGGVGNGTVIDHIEVIANLDDGVEFFGGTVDASNIVVWGVGDDSVDIDQAYSGTVSNVAIVMTNVSDHGLEIDGPEGSAPGMYTLQNVTIFSDDSETNSSSGNREYAQFRSGAMGTNSNILLVGGLTDSDFTLDDNQNTADSYTAGDLTFSGIEIVLPEGVSDVSTLFTDATGTTTFQDDATGTNGFVSEVADTDAATVGADLSVYGWTWVSEAASALGF
jgi:nitrogen fixation protein